jgi:hypothetical protein
MNYEQINFEPLKEKSKHPVLESVFAILALIFLILCIVAAIKAKIHNDAKQAIIAFPSIILALAFLKFTDMVSTKSVGASLFIAANNFGRTDSGDFWQQIEDQLVALNGRLKNKKLGSKDFRVGNSFGGILAGRQFNAFELIKSQEDVIDQNKLIDLRPYMLIMNFNLGRDLPHIFIADRKSGEGAKSAAAAFDETWLYQQPGNFKAINKDIKNYAVYAPDKLEPEALTLLSPTVLEAIASSGAGADIEFLNGRLLIYQYIGWMENRYVAYKNAFGLAAKLLPAMERTLQTMRFDANGALNQQAKDIMYPSNNPS